MFVFEKTERGSEVKSLRDFWWRELIIINEFSKSCVVLVQLLPSIEVHLAMRELYR